MFITHSTRIAGRIAEVAIGITIAGLTMGSAPALADPGRGPDQCGFQGCRGPGQRGPDGPPGDSRGPGARPTGAAALVAGLVGRNGALTATTAAGDLALRHPISAGAASIRAASTTSRSTTAAIG